MLETSGQIAIIMTVAERHDPPLKKVEDLLYHQGRAGSHAVYICDILAKFLNKDCFTAYPFTDFVVLLIFAAANVSRLYR